MVHDDLNQSIRWPRTALSRSGLYLPTWSTVERQMVGWWGASAHDSSRYIPPRSTATWSGLPPPNALSRLATSRSSDPASAGGSWSNQASLRALAPASSTTIRRSTTKNVRTAEKIETCPRSMCRPTRRSEDVDGECALRREDSNISKEDISSFEKIATVRTRSRRVACLINETRLTCETVRSSGSNRK